MIGNSVVPVGGLKMSKIAWIGLGVMGGPMAGHLREKGGHELKVYNRTRSKALEWVSQYGGRLAETAGKAAAGAELVFCCVGNDDDLREVTLGPDGAFHRLNQGALFIDHTTASADVARELDLEARQCKAGFLDAPVSGGQAGAELGMLTIMVGGEKQHFERAESLMENYSRKISLMGPTGAGQLAKMVNQICVAGLIQALAEGIHFAEKANLDIPLVIETISKGAAQSWQMENRWQTMMDGEFDFGFAVDWMCKDLNICLDEAARNGAQLPVTRTLEGWFREIQKMGGGRWDTSSLIERLRRL